MYAPDLRIAKPGLTATVYLAGGQSLVGEFFVEQASPGDAPGRAIRILLNDRERRFLPFRLLHGGPLCLLNRSSISMAVVNDSGADRQAAGRGRGTSLGAGLLRSHRWRARPEWLSRPR